MSTLTKFCICFKNTFSNQCQCSVAFFCFIHQKNVIVLFNQVYRYASSDDVADFTFFGFDALICLLM
jgi:hypothetical protein